VESHPLSVASISTDSFSVIVSGEGGDWSRSLAAFAENEKDEAAGIDLDVEVSGPFPNGGGGWSLPGTEAARDVSGIRGREDDDSEPEPEPALLLLAGGTGITGWLPVGLRVTINDAYSSSALPCRVSQ